MWGQGDIYTRKIEIERKVQEKEQEVASLEFRLKCLPENQKIARGRVIISSACIFVCVCVIFTVIATADSYNAFSLIRLALYPIVFIAAIVALTRELLRQLKNIATYTQEQIVLPARLSKEKIALNGLLTLADEIEQQFQDMQQKATNTPEHQSWPDSHEAAPSSQSAKSSPDSVQWSSH